MTQDELDADWLEHVHRPHERQLSIRAVLTGMLLGGVMSVSNLYVGLRTGWGLGVTVTAAVLTFGVFSTLHRVAPFGPFRQEFTSLENNIMASAASAAGYFIGAGLISAVPALFLATGVVLGGWQLAAWLVAISFLGVLLAVPMRRQMIDIDRLPFPEGLAYAETIRALHAAPGEARRKARVLFFGGLVGAAVKIAGSVTGVLKPVVLRLHAPLLPARLPIFERWAPLTLGIHTDLLMVAGGAMMGLRISSGLLLGALVSWGLLGRALFAHGLAGDSPSFATIARWTLWPGVTLVVVHGLLAFALGWRRALEALRGLARMATGSAAHRMTAVEVPVSWFVRGMIVCTIAVVALGWLLFDIPPWLGVIAVALSSLLSIVACRATGETSITPVSALGKITQLVAGGLGAVQPQANLMTASVTAGAATHAADLLTDLKAGHVLGAKPRHQFVSQLFGVLAGAAFCVPAYLLLATPERLGSADFPVPAARTWQAVAELVAGGIDSRVRGTAEARPSTVAGVALRAVPPGTRAGDRLRIDDAPSSDEYPIEAVAEGAVTLRGPLAAAGLEPGAAITVVGRGRAYVTGSRELPAFALASLPEGGVLSCRRGDYVRCMDCGRELWWSIVGCAGDRLVVDRAVVDPESRQPLTRPVSVEIRKESLPPYALVAILVAALLAAALTLAEAYAPARVRRWVPSPTAVGLGFMVSGFDSISMCIGAVLRWLLERFCPELAKRYLQVGASGIMAGASLSGITIVLLDQVARVIATA